MDRALAAGRLRLSETAMVQSMVGITKQGGALFAERGVPCLVVAVEPDHLLYGLFLLINA